VFHPKFTLKLGSLNVESKKNKNLISLSIEQNLEIPSNIFITTFSNDQKQSIMGIKKGDESSVSLGYDDDFAEVFTGIVDSIETEANSIRICSLTSMIKLCRLKVDLFFESQTSGGIVKELTKLAEVKIEKGSPLDGIQFPYYAIDSNKNTYEHVKELARLNGFITYMNNKDELVFKRFESRKTHSLEFGKDIVFLSRTQNTSQSKEVAVFGESPSGVMGLDRSHWLTKKQIKGEAKVDTTQAIKPGAAMLLYNRFLKDDETTSLVAESVAARLKLSEVIDLKVPGSHQMMLGDAVQLKNVPDESLDTKYQIRRIYHNMNKMEGFVTTLRCVGPL
jgi:phage protein D